MLNVTWCPPTRTGNLPITEYKIQYTYSRTNKQNVHNTSNTGAQVLKKLNPGTTYRVKVKAVNALGEGMSTKEIEAMTQPRGLSLHAQLKYQNM